MTSNDENTEKPVKKNLEQLDHLFAKSSKFLAVTHNNPDPDAIASAAALAFLVKNRYKINVSLAYRGNIGRAENRAMIDKLSIHLKQFNRVHLKNYDRIALVDGQPYAGNTPDMDYNLVIDHHPMRKDTKGDVLVIRPDVGVTATILVEWLIEADIDIPVNLATALAYAISSETQNLGRESCRADIQAYLHVYTRASMRKLAQILHPKLPRDYFINLARTLHRTIVFRHLICAHLGDIPAVEIVSEMADFLLRLERASWSFCTGRFKGQLILSVRTTNTNARAGKLVKQMVYDSRTVGGHDMIAGGYVDVEKLKAADIDKLEDELTQKFAAIRGFRDGTWKPLIPKPTASEMIKEIPNRVDKKLK